jgi:pimeloyl-ACP methyl ester carboxylesterase
VNASAVKTCAAISLFLFASTGCSDPSSRFITPERMNRGMVVVLHGIEGPGYLNREICRGLDYGGVDTAIRNYEWSSEWGALYNLRASHYNRLKAEELARWISDYIEAFPGRPVTLIGHSGGGAIAVWAAESMQGDEKIDGLILINPAISRDYDLGRALENTKRGIVNFHSQFDWLLLGVGTRVAGTMDRKHEVSAGKDGFLIPESRPESCRRLYQIGWSGDMLISGHWGGHLSSSTAAFVAMYVSPLVMSREWSGKLIEDIRKGRVRWSDGSVKD